MVCLLFPTDNRLSLNRLRISCLSRIHIYLMWSLTNIWFNKRKLHIVMCPTFHGRRKMTINSRNGSLTCFFYRPIFRNCLFSFCKGNDALFIDLKIGKYGLRSYLNFSIAYSPYTVFYTAVLKIRIENSEELNWQRFKKIQNMLAHFIYSYYFILGIWLLILFIDGSSSNRWENFRSNQNHN